jgi:uncharacterized membrane protein YeaQ/YmgE (transglycosylase-associated protein family)
MGFLVLIAVGGILGWLASILSRSDDRRGLIFNVAVGVIGAVAAGALGSTTPLTAGLSASALLLAAVVASILLCVVNFARSSRAN